MFLSIYNHLTSLSSGVSQIHPVFLSPVPRLPRPPPPPTTTASFLLKNLPKKRERLLKNMKSKFNDIKISWKTTLLLLLLFFLCSWRVEVCYGQDHDNNNEKPKALPANTELDNCNGIFLEYNFDGRDKLVPHVKNVTAQAWAFQAEAVITNAGDTELKDWKMYIGFHNREILVSAENAVAVDVADLPAEVGNGTTLSGNPIADLKTAIETAGDITQMQVRIPMKGTQFGLATGKNPMPQTIKLVNDGFKCPAPQRTGTYMFVCCQKDPKARAQQNKTKFLPRRYGDITIAYDVIQAMKNNYQAQVTIDNNHPLGRLDHWNLTWEWQRGEFIYSLRGAYSHRKDSSACLYGPAGRYYQDFDFSPVVNCDKKPIISDLPSERADDEKIGKIPYCCRNGTVLPVLMDKSKSRSVFQLQVFKIPPDDNRTALTPPLKWKIDGVVNPQYNCAAPIRVDPKEFPDPTGLDAVTTAIASWQIVCNITKPKPQAARCCVSFSAFYNESAIPCNTCACGCQETKQCSSHASPMLSPPEALLIPFVNRTMKAKAWAKMKHLSIPKKLPCGDNCPVSINWHVSSDHKGGWTARMTLLNWENYGFEDWFAAIQTNRTFEDFQAVYSFNGTRIPGLHTVVFQGLKGLNYLAGETNGTHESNPRVPGKQQSVISFSKKHTKDFDIRRDGFPTKVFFNGEECALPRHTPAKSSGHQTASISFLGVILIGFMNFLTTEFTH